MPKGKKFGGRKKGTPNKSSLRVEEIAQRLGCDPFEILCNFANGDWKRLGYENECYFSEKPDGAVKMNYVINPEMRLTAAKEAVKYLHAQKKAVELSTDPEGRGIQINVVDYTKAK